MFSFGELVLLAVIAVIFIGPKELPKVARYVGKLMREIRRIGFEFQKHLSAPDEEVKNLSDDISKKINEAVGIEKFEKAPTDPKDDSGGPTKH